MAKDELLIVKKERNNDRLRFKIVDKETNRWSPNKYQKVIASKDYNLLAYLFYDLWSMGYNIPRAYTKFKELTGDPELFFLK